MTILIVDGANFMHRARSGFTSSEYAVVYNFFRQLKALVEQFSPSRVIFTLEGHPRQRLELLSEYKANRAADVTTEKGRAKQKTLEDYHRQAGLIVDLLVRHFPLSVMRHPDHEADDLVHNIVKNASISTDFVVVSTDSDFIQMLQRFSNVRLYHPIAKKYVTAPEYDYVYWKSLRGDGTDNVSKLPGIDDATAAALLEDPDALRAVLTEHGATFERNVKLIRFIDFDVEELQRVESSSPTRDWATVKSAFLGYGFASIVKEPYWSKFQSIFDSLWAIDDKALQS